MSHLVDVLASLASSENKVAAGLGETLQAFAVAASYPSPGPILIEFGHRTMALGRKRMAAMTGRNAFVYVKGKFGLLNASTPLFLQAVITGKTDGAFVEIDLDAWEEIVPYIEKLRIIT
ncbi:hypothetical protein EV361DRAFT_793100 [Lentinula raphanica]|uniref:Uncharacterized protein n=1 Tax=Lentinula raphanica TaxID=153919 RepID=A0AA38P0A1_9AGAR|nr:hypothetical protein C8R42DRAFT_717786 [Lentinula raphanica]KAJ3762461.1 hypothetical protein EV360DRAFT_35663 [Lentinula raphanica]KAJ3773345.1 hypothetical protein FB446DRAFT_787896 [Lentinula raphanica]KAJ3826828.1 hypothetical protein F5880DRAFT_24463 [Lentinula raphanica]KAJ3833917.1 hypothetical protein F5878DRAFT_381953 [Lentinula raphanica]